jgi:HD superfamily phosphohydrolase
MSVALLRHLIDENAIDLPEEDVHLIETLISGEYGKKEEERAFLFDIVANKRNSVDVDKFDYLARDAYNCGMTTSFNSSRVLIFSRVIDNQVCYHAKEGWNLNSLFNTRYSMFKQVYSHRVGNSIEHMVGDAFTLADPYLKIAEQTDSAETYTYLTDAILKTIESSRMPELEPARAVIRRLRKRDLYRLADELIIPSGEFEKWKIPTAAELITYQPSSTITLQEEDIIVDSHVNNYGMKDKNPINFIKFYGNDPHKSFSLRPEEISLLGPTTFAEKYVRIFSRSPDPDKITLAFDAWQNYLLKEKGKSYSSSPTKKISPVKRKESKSRRKLDFGNDDQQSSSSSLGNSQELNSSTSKLAVSTDTL